MRTRACIVVIGRELYSHVGDDGTDFDGFENANEVRLAHFDLLLALYCLLLAGCWLLLAGCCLLLAACCLLLALCCLLFAACCLLLAPCALRLAPCDLLLAAFDRSSWLLTCCDLQQVEMAPAGVVASLSATLHQVLY